jgi:hypothetical protein
MVKDASGRSETPAPHSKDPDGTLKVINACLAGIGALYMISNSLIVTVLGATTAVTMAFVYRLAR